MIDATVHDSRSDWQGLVTKTIVFLPGLLEYPQYTRPYDYRGMVVPDVLMVATMKNSPMATLRESKENLRAQTRFARKLPTDSRRRKMLAEIKENKE